MGNVLYFKDMKQKDEHNRSKVIYRVEDHKMFLEVLDKKHPMGCAKYFSSIRSRDDFVNSKKDYLIRISENEAHNMVEYWKNIKVYD